MSDVGSQKEALDAQGGWFQSPLLQRVEVTGEDRLSFLQNMCTNDLRPLEPGQNVEAFFLNVKGHVLAHVLVSCREDHLVLHLLGSSAEELIAHLDRYIIREEVQLSATVKPIAILVSPAASSPASFVHSVTFVAEPFPLLQRPAWLLEFNSDSDRREARSEAHQVLPHLTSDEAAWERLRIEAGWPLAGVDFSSGTLPQELNRDTPAISFRKGCYLGQETVARLDALGHVNRQLAGVAISRDTPPLVGSPFQLEEREVGRLTSVAFSPLRDRWVGLAMLRREAHAVGTQLRIGTATAEVIRLPVTS